MRLPVAASRVAIAALAVSLGACTSSATPLPGTPTAWRLIEHRAPGQGYEGNALLAHDAQEWAAVAKDQLLPDVPTGIDFSREDGVLLVLLERCPGYDKADYRVEDVRRGGGQLVVYLAHDSLPSNVVCRTVAVREDFIIAVPRAATPISSVKATDRSGLQYAPDTGPSTTRAVPLSSSSDG